MKIYSFLCVLLGLASICYSVPFVPGTTKLSNSKIYIAVAWGTPDGIVYQFGANVTKLTSTYKLSGIAEVVNSTKLVNQIPFSNLEFKPSASKDGLSANLTATPVGLRFSQLIIAHVLKNDSNSLELDYYLTNYKFLSNSTQLAFYGSLISDDKKNLTSKDTSVETSSSFYQISNKATVTKASELLLADSSVKVSLKSVKNDVWTVYDHFNGAVLTHKENYLGLGKPKGSNKTWLIIVIGVAVALAIIAAIVVACIVVKKRKNYEVV
jgi:hypothetical protein